MYQNKSLVVIGSYLYVCLQYNYLIDEKDTVGKGPNCVASILHYHLETYYSDIATLVLFCDNCVGQNKNNTVLSYLQWRVDRGLNKTILFNFLLTGHTKFAPDRYFGIFKAKYAVSNIDTYDELLQCVVDSSPGGYNKSVSAENVTWYEWDSFLKPFYKLLVGITQFHHFIIGTDCVKTKKFADSEDFETFRLLRQPILGKMPPVIQPPGLSLDRQWYIYNNLRSLVSDTKNADILAPLPQKKLPAQKQKEMVPAQKEKEKVPAQKRKGEVPAQKRKGKVESAVASTAEPKFKAAPKKVTPMRRSTRSRINTYN